MDLKNIWSCLMILAFATTCHAYWWSPASSTEAPSVKHIPLGYFRTYTYQPVGAASPLSFSFLGTAVNPFNWPSRVPSAPILSGSRYELMSQSTSTEKSKPPLPPPTTTTTTTTTTTSTEPPSPPPPPLPTQPSHDRMPIPLINSPNSINSGLRYSDQTSSGAFSQYYGGMYNRRSLPYFQQQQQPPNFFRPYPYPDYTMQPQHQASNQKPSVQFVPCMCPINLAQYSNDVAETRSIPEGDELSIPRSTDNPNENENSVDDVAVDREDDVDKKPL